MATRYSGDLKIHLVYDDRGFYRTSVSQKGVNLWRGQVRPAPAGFGAGVAYDSDRAYDKIAESAIAFADDEVGGLGDLAEHDAHGFKIRRVAGYWQKWPGGQIRPKRLRDSHRGRSSRDGARFKIGERVHKTMGVRQAGKVIARIPRSAYTDGSYREPGPRERVTYVAWDDGTRGWVHTAHLESAPSRDPHRRRRKVRALRGGRRY